MAYHMSTKRHILIGQGAIDVQVAQFSIQLKAIVLQYRFRQIDKRRAKKMGERRINQHYKAMLGLSKSRTIYALGPGASLMPEDKKRLDRWKEQTIDDFEAIIDDVR